MGLYRASLPVVTKIMVGLHTTQQPFTSSNGDQRRGVTLQCVADRSRHKRPCAAEHCISSLQRSIHTRPFHDIRLRLSPNQRYCTNIEKAQRGKKNKKHRWGGVTETVASYSVIKLHFRRSIYIVCY